MELLHHEEQTRYRLLRWCHQFLHTESTGSLDRFPSTSWSYRETIKLAQVCCASEHYENMGTRPSWRTWQMSSSLTSCCRISWYWDFITLKLSGTWDSSQVLYLISFSEIETTKLKSWPLNSASLMHPGLVCSHIVTMFALWLWPTADWLNS